MLAVIGPEGDQGSVYKIVKLFISSDESRKKLLGADDREVIKSIVLCLLVALSFSHA